MEVRHLNNIDPKKIWTLDDIKKLRKNVKDKEIFSEYNDDFILKLFNEVALNDLQNNLLLYAKLGNIIERFRKNRKYLQGGTLSTNRKKDILLHVYELSEFDNNKSPKPYYSWVSDWSDDVVNYIYDNNFKDNPNLIYSPYDMGVEVVGYRPLKLHTWYPMVHTYYNPDKDKKYKLTGHSAITGGLSGTKYFNDYDYNLITNNCSDETRRMLEQVFNKKLNAVGFTTPGDVRDFAKLNGGKSLDELDREIIIPMNKEKYTRLNSYIKLRRLKRHEWFILNKK